MFTMKPGEIADLSWADFNAPGAHLENMRFDFYPLQQISGWPFSVYGNQFPRKFTNTTGFELQFDCTGYENILFPIKSEDADLKPEKQNRDNWQKMVDVTVSGESEHGCNYQWRPGQGIVYEITVWIED